MKFAFQEGLFPFNSEKELYARLADRGFDAVEVSGVDLVDRLDKVKAASAAAGLPVCAICPGLDGIRGSLLDEDARARLRARDDILALLRCGAELGGAGLNLVPQFGGVKFMKLYPDPSDFINRKQQFIDTIAPLAAEAAKLGAPILLEPLNRYEAYFLITVDQAAEVCRACASPALKILADLFHAHIEESDPAAAITRNAAHIAHIHAADSNRKLPGQGHTDFAPVFHALNSAGYRGYISMECAVTGDPAKELPKALAVIKSIAAEKMY